MIKDVFKHIIKSIARAFMASVMAAILVGSIVSLIDSVFDIFNGSIAEGILQILGVLVAYLLFGHFILNDKSECE